MIAYNPQWIENLYKQQQVNAWKNEGCIDADMAKRLSQLYTTGFYTPGNYMRAGMFVIGLLVALSAMGLVTLIMIPALESVFKGLLFVYSAVAVLALEHQIKNKHYYRAGVDDALLYLSIILYSIAISFLAGGIRSPEILIATLIFPALVIGAVRYLDRISTVGALLCLVYIIFQLLAKAGPVIKSLLPFILMGLSTAGYFYTRKTGKLNRFLCWKENFTVLELCFLILFYASGNYYVVRELSGSLLNVQLKPGEDIPMAWFFYLFTFSVPVGYIYSGLKSKNRMLLQSGLLLIVASVLTIRYYYHLIAPEIALTIGGSFLLMLCVITIKWINLSRHGFSLEQGEKEEGELDLKGLFIAQLVSRKGAPKGPKDIFGGGQFGGGGASGNF